MSLFRSCIGLKSSKLKKWRSKNRHDKNKPSSIPEQLDIEDNITVEVNDLNNSTSSDQSSLCSNVTSSDSTADVKVTVLAEDAKSVEWRKKGNERYQAAGTFGINKLLRASRLEEALKFYHNAYKTAENESEIASAAKNIGVANMKLVPLHKNNAVFIEVIQACNEECLTYLDKARVVGESCMGRCWVDAVETLLKDSISAAFTCHNHLPYRKRAAVLEKYINCLQDSIHKARCYFQVAKLLFNGAIIELEKQNYKQVLDDLSECYRPIEEAVRLSSDDEILVNKLNELTEDRLLHSCIAESIQAIHIGDEMFTTTLKNEEGLNMTQVRFMFNNFAKYTVDPI